MFINTFICSRLQRQASMPSVNGPATAPPPPVQESPTRAPTVQRSHTAYGIGGSQDSPKPARVMVRSASSAKELILQWVQSVVNTYPVRFPFATKNPQTSSYDFNYTFPLEYECNEFFHLLE